MQAPDLTARLLRAEASCAARGQRLTDVRRAVLSLILQSGEPLGAYALLEKLQTASGRGKPPTVYRALDFLMAQGLIHRVERLNAFVPCHDETAHDDHGHPHPAQFFICAQCGLVAEMEDEAMGQALEGMAGRAGFVIHRATVEIEGLCQKCARN